MKDSVETCRSMIICKLIVIVLLLVIAQNNKMHGTYIKKKRNCCICGHCILHTKRPTRSAHQGNCILMHIYICCPIFICLIMAKYDPKHVGDMVMLTKVYVT
jgi:hypothetical protein